MYKPLEGPRNNQVDHELSSKAHTDGEYRNLSWSSTGAELGLGFGLELGVASRTDLALFL